jgi:hypothetical protein
MLVEVNLMLQPGLPVLGVLNLIEKQILEYFALGLAFVPQLQESIETQQLLQRVVERCVKNLVGSDPTTQQLIDGLQKQGGLADLSSPGEQQRTMGGGLDHPVRNLAKRRSSPGR